MAVRSPPGRGVPLFHVTPRRWQNAKPREHEPYRSDLIVVPFADDSTTFEHTRKHSVVRHRTTTDFGVLWLITVKCRGSVPNNNTNGYPNIEVLRGELVSAVRQPSSVWADLRVGKPVIVLERQRSIAAGSRAARHDGDRVF